MGAYILIGNHVRNASVTESNDDSSPAACFLHVKGCYTVGLGTFPVTSRGSRCLGAFSWAKWLRLLVSVTVLSVSLCLNAKAESFAFQIWPMGVHRVRSIPDVRDSRRFSEQRGCLKRRSPCYRMFRGPGISLANADEILGGKETLDALDDGTRNSSSAASVQRSSTRPSGERHVNARARVLMNIILNHFKCLENLTSENLLESTPTGIDRFTMDPLQPEWFKMRRYLYNAVRPQKSNRALPPSTRHQVEQVLRFLQDSFPSDAALQRHIIQTLPRILRRQVPSHLQPTVNFLRELYGSELLAQAVQRNPYLLLTSGAGYRADSLDSVHVFLQQTLLLSNPQLDRLKRVAPFVFRTSLSRILELVKFLTDLLEQGSALPDASCGVESPQTLPYAACIRRLIVSHPTLVQLSVSNTLAPRVQFLREECRLSPDDLVALLLSGYASILTLSEADNIQPKVQYLRQILREDQGISKHGSNSRDSTEDGGAVEQELLRKCIMANPSILGLSLANLQRKVEYFRAIDDVSFGPRHPTSSLASRILRRAPTVYSLSLLENVIPTVNYLARVWNLKALAFDLAGKWEVQEDMVVSMTQADHEMNGRSGPSSSSKGITLSSMIGEYPSILTLSLQGNIQPTVEFFHRAGYISFAEDPKVEPTGPRSSLVKQYSRLRGRHVAASLYNLLLPRWYYVNMRKGHIPSGHENGNIELVGENNAGQQPLIPLRILVFSSDTRFCEQMGLDDSDFVQFKKQAIPRLKFTSQFETWVKTGRPIDIS